MSKYEKLIYTIEKFEQRVEWFIRNYRARIGIDYEYKLKTERALLNLLIKVYCE